MNREILLKFLLDKMGWLEHYKEAKKGNNEHYTVKMLEGMPLNGFSVGSLCDVVDEIYGKEYSKRIKYFR